MGVFWMIIALSVTTFIAFYLMLKAWREAKRSPYFFQRKQATVQTQNYLLGTLTLAAITVSMVVYAYSPSQIETPLVKLLTNAKPAQARISQSADSLATTDSAPLVVTDNSKIANLTFTTAPNSAETVAQLMEGKFTVYANFNFDAMADGANWSWVWKRNGEEVKATETVWENGPTGQAYLYLRPKNGFVPGIYSLEMYVEGQLHAMHSVEVVSNLANR